MTRRLFLLIVLMLGVPASAEEAMIAEDIKVLLTGNTIEGTWSGRRYAQYFDPGGLTVYIEEERPPEFGRWRVNSDTNEYESWWQQTNWVGYKILRDGNSYAWKRSKGNAPFDVLTGRQISW